MAYVRRQNHLQRNQAVHVLNAYAEALNGGSKPRNQAPQHHGARAPSGKKISSDEMLANLGAHFM